MNTPKTTAKDFFLWAGAIVAFYWSVLAYTFLVFEYINYAIPDALSYLPDPYQSGISFEMASIIILFPIYLLLMWLIHRDTVADSTKSEIWVRRWALIFTLFLAGITLAGDLITLLTRFLSGEEITTSFFLKVLVILIVAGGVFTHFIFDLRGYWAAHPARRMWVRIGVAVLAFATIVAGFFIVGTPQHARLMRLDDQKVSDLQGIQYDIGSYYQAKQALPASLTALNSIQSYSASIVDSQTNTPYEYRATGATTYELCATFNAVGTSRYEPMNSYAGYQAADTTDSNRWDHAAGHVCFLRTIDPSFYPPTTVPAKLPM